MEKSNFDDLLERYLEGNVTPEEKQKLEAWLEMRKTKNVTDLELSDADEERLFKKIVSRTTSAGEIEKFLPGKPKQIRLPILAIAASILVLALATIVWRMSDRKEGLVNKQLLPDGSIVWSTDGSRVNYAERDGIRFVSFTGDALFEVAKDPGNPFEISAGDVRVRITGTSFRLVAAGEKTEVAVLTGKVEVTDTDGGVHQLSSREKLTLSPDGAPLKTALSQDDVLRMVQGSNYDMKFTNASLAEVLRRVEQKFDVEITVADRKINDCRITADFTDRSLKSTLNMIAEVTEVEFTKNANALTASGKGCD